MRLTVRTPNNREGKVRQVGPVPGFFIALIGLALLAGAAWTGKNTYELTTRGLHVEGRISDVMESLETRTYNRNGFSETVTEKQYRYMVTFKDKNGVEVTFKDLMSENHRSRQKGDAVPVIYLEKDANGSATIDRGALNWLLPGLLGIFGVFAVGGGGVAMFRRPAPVSG